MNVLMLGVLLVMMLVVSMHSTTDPTNTRITRGKHTGDPNTFFGEITILNIGHVNKEGRLKKGLMFEEVNYGDPPQTAFKVKNVHLKSVNSKDERCSKATEVINSIQDPNSKLKIKNVESRRVKKAKLSFLNKVKKFDRKLFNDDGITNEKQHKRNVFELNKKTKKVSTVKRIPVS